MIFFAVVLVDDAAEAAVAAAAATAAALYLGYVWIRYGAPAASKALDDMKKKVEDTFSKSEATPADKPETCDKPNEPPEGETTEAPPEAPPIPDDPTQPPGPGWKWRGKGSPGSPEGSWHNPTTGESLHPDLQHPEPIGPHWDYRAPNRTDWRVFPDGRVLPK